MRRLMIAAVLLLTLIGVVTPALADQCKLTAFAAFCDTESPDRNDYILHPTWTDNQGCTATFRYEYRVYATGNTNWELIVDDTPSTLIHWTAPAYAAYQFRVTILCDRPCSCGAVKTDCERIYPLNSGLSCRE